MPAKAFQPLCCLDERHITGIATKRNFCCPDNKSSDQPLHERMRQGNIGHRLDFCYVQDSQIGLPLVKSIERIVVGAEILRHRPVASNGLIEHTAERDAIDRSGMDAEPNNPAGVLVHEDQDPVGSERG